MGSTGQRYLALGITGLIVYGVAVLILHAIENSILYAAPQQSERWGTLAVKRPDLTLRGWLVNPENTDALVVFGGNGLALAPVGHAWTGCVDRAIYLVPYRGYEGQAGHPREEALVEDGVALVEQAQREHRHVAIIGISLGTGIATQVAVRTHPDRLLLVTPYDRLDLVGEAYFPRVPVRWLMRDRYDSAAAAARLGSMPVSVLQADNDEVIPAERTRALVSALPSAPVIWKHVATTHNGVWAGNTLCKFLAESGMAKRQAAAP